MAQRHVVKAWLDNSQTLSTDCVNKYVEVFKLKEKKKEQPALFDGS